MVKASPTFKDPRRVFPAVSSANAAAAHRISIRLSASAMIFFILFISFSVSHSDY